ncbi:MAG: insulinase family protein [Clostridium sp.]|uniref:insulinase family protein n=1 Tax=Clostridium sp. TaxID=1506 RepID=UPI003D6CA1FE
MLKRSKKFCAVVVAGLLFIQPACSIMGYTHIAVATTIKDSGVTVSKDYHGFTLDKKSFSKDLNSMVYEFVYKKNGGKLVYIENNDSNKWFDITFKTPTSNDTGVNHIIEHTVLEASEKFNFKSPFTEIGKRSVNTYMNALTGQDWTSYPIASENDKDFQNLMEVYLDAVFAPKVVTEPNLLMQEGWRYALDAKTGNLSCNGIVLNEMKGAMSGKTDEASQTIKKLMYPDTKYKFNSGGDPRYIIDLTHEQLATTHKKYYNPSNACIMLYGKMDIDSKLEYISKNYYSKYEKSPQIKDDKIQVPFKEVKKEISNYPADSTATKDKDSILTFNMVLNNVDQKDRLGLELLNVLLTGADDAPIKKAVLDKKLGVDLSSGVDTWFYQPLFSITLEGASSKKINEFENIIKTTLKETSENGFKKEKIEALINSSDLQSKVSLLSVNNGENTMYNIINGFITQDNPMLRLNDSDVIQDIKKEAMQGRYFENLINKYLLNNNHLSLVAFEPDSQFMTKINTSLDEKIEKIQKNLKAKEFEEIKKSIDNYAKYEKKPVDKQALKTLPSLKISDLISKNSENKVTEKQVTGVKVLEHEVDSKGTTQLQLYFDLSTLTQQELSYLELFKAVMLSSNTKNYTLDKIEEMITLYSTGIGMQELIIKDQNDKDNYYPLFTVKSIFLNENADKMTNIMIEKLKNTKIDDKENIKEKLEQVVNELSNKKTEDTFNVVRSRLEASLTKANAVSDIKYNEGYKVLVQANEDFEKSYDDIIKNLGSIYGKVFNKNNCKISVASDLKGIKNCEKGIDEILKSLSEKSIKKEEWSFGINKTKTAMIIPAEVQYVSLGFNSPVNGSDYVFANMLNNGYMYEKIRLEGGAYGGGLRAYENGNFMFYTYRDPKLKESVEKITQMEEYLKDFKPTQEEIEAAIISIIGELDTPKDVYAKVNTQDTQKIAPYDSNKKEKLRKEVLATTIKDLPAFVSKIEKGFKGYNLVVGGSKEKIDENKNMFDSISGILD